MIILYTEKYKIIFRIHERESDLKCKKNKQALTVQQLEAEKAYVLHF